MDRRNILRLFAAAAGSWAARPGIGSLLGATALSQAPGGELQEEPQEGSLLPLFPLPVVLFPKAHLPLHIFEPRYKEMIQECLENRSEFGIILTAGGSIGGIGCSASVVELLRRYPDGQMDIVVQGRRRFRVSALDEERSFLRGKAQFFEDDETEPPPEALRSEALRLRRRLLSLLAPDDPAPADPPPAGDASLSFQLLPELPASLPWKQTLLELRSERERLTRIVQYLEEWVKFLDRAPDRRAPTGAL